MWRVKQTNWEIDKMSISVIKKIVSENKKHGSNDNNKTNIW